MTSPEAMSPVATCIVSSQDSCVHYSVSRYIPVHTEAAANVSLCTEPCWLLRLCFLSYAELLAVVSPRFGLHKSHTLSSCCSCWSCSCSSCLSSVCARQLFHVVSSLHTFGFLLLQQLQSISLLLHSCLVLQQLQSISLLLRSCITFCMGLVAFARSA